MTRTFGRFVRTATAAAMLSATMLSPALADTTLKFVSWQVDDAGTGDWWKAAIAAFEEANPGVKVEFTKVERAAYADTMTTLFAGGQPPHIVHLASFEFQSFAENGWMENLGPWLDKDGVDMTGWAGQGKCMWNGETACIMMNYFGFIMAYNKAILEKEGLSVPTTYAEFLEVARKTTKDFNGDGITDQYGTGHETKGGAGQYLTEMLSYILDAGAYWTDKDGNITIDTPQMVEGLTRWKTVVKEGLTPVDLSAGDIRKLFADGKMALRLDGPWLYGIMQKGAASADTAVAEPAFSPPVGGSSNVLGMASEISDEEKALVWDFIKLVMSPEWQRKYATIGKNTPPSPAADVSGVEQEVPHFPLLIKTMKAASDAGVDRIPTGLEIQYNEFGKMVQEEVQRMLIEDLDPAAVVKVMQERAETIKNGG
ncbi:ABC transporter substrate-binding protein [Stappia indica]|uniref:Extracellular solute-binding protein n=1 Tax=Stappia indica TaxID=538381 RepID=A0A857CBZ3_9HYPH|nr:sugar ABC transporter substrate-binding protein [Stappia indica]QGZ36540.1 extracellular solute-binding protein [Stappia indica]